MASLVQNHPFLDGNKRTGITAAALFLQRNGWRIMASNKELEQFTFQVTIERPALETIAAWLAANVVSN
jgi:death-on-curing protein